MDFKKSKITALNNSYNQLISQVAKATHDLREWRIVLHHGYFELIKINNKKQVFEFISNSSDNEYEIVSISKIFEIWTKECVEEISEFLQLSLQVHGTLEEQDLSYIFDWMYRYYPPIYGASLKETQMLHNILRKMERKVTKWTKTQIKNIPGETNPIYRLTKPEKRLLRMIINHDTNNLNNIPDQDFKKYLRRDKEFILSNYDIQAVWTAKRYVDYFWGDYNR